MRVKLLLFLLFFSSSVLAQEHSHEEASFPIGHSFRMMKTAGFWISRHPSPDAMIMSPDAINQFNARLHGDIKLTKDIFSLVQDLKTESLLDDLEKTLSDISGKGYYTAAGVRDD